MLAVDLIMIKELIQTNIFNQVKMIFIENDFFFKFINIFINFWVIKSPIKTTINFQ